MNKASFGPTGHKDIDELFERAQNLIEHGELLRVAIQKALSEKIGERECLTNYKKLKR